MTTLTTPRPKNKTGPKPGARFDIAPLEAVLLGEDATMRHLGGCLDYPADRVLPAYIAHVCKVQRGVVYRWKKEGLTAWAADKAAIALGLHPIIIWPDWAEGGTPYATHDGLLGR